MVRLKSFLKKNVELVIILGLLAPKAQANSEQEALSKIKEFGTTLKRELKKGLSKSPLEAVKVCNLKAPEIATKVSSKEIKIGRVSLKYRNPQNKPQKWMKSYIQKFHKKEIKKAYIVASLPNGKKGLLKPVQTMPLCLTCHGEKIEPTLSKEIKRLYPQDKATGYKVGQIRGFFWAEF